MEATMDPDAVAALAGLAGVAGLVGCFGYLVVAAIICVLLQMLYKAVPEEHRQLAPGFVWLLLIPIWNLIWNFFVFPKLSRSYQAWFEARGDTSKGTCNGGLALAYAIASACLLLAFIPCVGPLIGLASLALLIIYLVKMFGLKNEAIAAPAATAAGPMPPTAPEASTPPEEPGPPTDQGIPGI